MLLNILLWGSNSDGVPADWPRDVREVPDGSPAPQPPWQQMTPAAYVAYRAARQAEYDAWAAAHPVISVPSVVTNFQMRQALRLMPNPIPGGTGSMFGVVDAWVKASGPDTELYQAWEYGNEFERSSPFVAQAAFQFSFTGPQIDQLFVEASQITA